MLIERCSFCGIYKEDTKEKTLIAGVSAMVCYSCVTHLKEVMNDVECQDEVNTRRPKEHERID